MIKANTQIIRSTNDEKRLQGSVMIDVPKQLKPVAKIVLTQELGHILKGLNDIDPEIILDALKIYMEEVKNEQN